MGSRWRGCERHAWRERRVVVFDASSSRRFFLWQRLFSVGCTHQLSFDLSAQLVDKAVFFFFAHIDRLQGLLSVLCEWRVACGVVRLSARAEELATLNTASHLAFGSQSAIRHTTFD